MISPLEVIVVYSYSSFVPLYFSLIVAQETYSSGFPEHLKKILLEHFCLETVFVGLSVTQLPPLFRLSPEGQSYTFVSLANHYLFNSVIYK